MLVEEYLNRHEFAFPGALMAPGVLVVEQRENDQHRRRQQPGARSRSGENKIGALRIILTVVDS